MPSYITSNILTELNRPLVLLHYVKQQQKVDGTAHKLFQEA